MANVLQVFKIIMGLFISIFVLYFLVNYSGIYAGIQEDTQRAQVLRNFDKLSQDVYFTGITTDFDDFGRVKWPRLTFDPAPAAGLMTNLGKWAFKVPVLFTPVDEMLVARATLDLGWWKFHMVEAFPATRIILNVMEPGAWDTVVRDLVEVMPSTIAMDNKVIFDFCDSSMILTELCGTMSQQIPCERDYFIIELTGLANTAFTRCTAEIPKNAILVTVDDDCYSLFAQEGLCIIPPDMDGIGEAYLTGTEKAFIYKDGLDLAALIIGGDTTGIFGLAGENLWKYKNEAFAEEVSFAAAVTIESAELLKNRINTQLRRRELSRHSSTADCPDIYDTLQDALTNVQNLLKVPNYYTKTNTLRQLKLALSQAKSAHDGLISRGCEYL